MLIKMSSDHVPIKAWADHVKIEEDAWEQARNLAKMPFIYKHVALMPDAHWGMGSTVGSVIATKGAIIPAAVGVDIGCGMIAMKTSLVANDLPDSLSLLRDHIERAVPHGRTNDGGNGDRGAWHSIPLEVDLAWQHELDGIYRMIIAFYPGIEPKKHPRHHLGTLGTGNHFIELCLDEKQCVWIMLHSGSRGIGNKIGTYFIDKAKEEMLKWHITPYLPDENLAYLVEHTDLYDDYIDSINWAQEYASVNRQIMMNAVKRVLERYFNRGIDSFELAINCHHNYATQENHFGKNVWITRKGAVLARENVLGIIPGSMGAKSFIVRGKGNADSFHSCSHGAGRSMSRNQAKKKFSIEDHIKATEGVECRKDEDVIDETPGAYKDIDAVMASQIDLIEIVHTLKQILCVKG